VRRFGSDLKLGVVPAAGTSFMSNIPPIVDSVQCCNIMSV
jgi:hypothetical protein